VGSFPGVRAPSRNGLLEEVRSAGPAGRRQRPPSSRVRSAVRRAGRPGSPTEWAYSCGTAPDFDRLRLRDAVPAQPSTRAAGAGAGDEL